MRGAVAVEPATERVRSAVLDTVEETVSERSQIVSSATMGVGGAGGRRGWAAVRGTGRGAERAASIGGAARRVVAHRRSS